MAKRNTIRADKDKADVSAPKGPHVLLRKHVGKQRTKQGQVVEVELEQLRIFLRSSGSQQEHPVGFVGKHPDAPICLTKQLQQNAIDAIHQRVGPQENGQPRRVSAPPAQRAVREYQDSLEADADD